MSLHGAAETEHAHYTEARTCRVEGLSMYSVDLHYVRYVTNTLQYMARYITVCSTCPKSYSGHNTYCESTTNFLHTIEGCVHHTDKIRHAPGTLFTTDKDTIFMPL